MPASPGSKKRPTGTLLISPGALVANSLCPGQEKRTMRCFDLGHVSNQGRRLVKLRDQLNDPGLDSV